ncbi:hypothetical protein [Clostridium cylindrosporum]|uniref:Uncharacterized protein n=1 Tax=Clostridium cylindrosporum DSM 605 TaxID=1121307 RepID=A0A0J8DAL3_CLOCY|nr:hypothetical protein [Clostridium cylindrosporum]KMT23070.1 hypothetical protein CLCY_7c01170 [Clostridium cylindrosporum DSM 605]
MTDIRNEAIDELITEAIEELKQFKSNLNTQRVLKEKYEVKYKLKDLYKDGVFESEYENLKEGINKNIDSLHNDIARVEAIVDELNSIKRCN